MDAVQQGPPDPLVRVVLSRRPSVYPRYRQDCALFTFAQFGEMSWPERGQYEVTPAAKVGVTDNYVVEDLLYSRPKLL